MPAYCEEPRIADTVGRIRPSSPNSTEPATSRSWWSTTDRPTAPRRRPVAAGADRVVVQPENRGKGAAVRAGVAVASGRTIAFTDADLAYAPRQILPMLEAVEAGWDVVIGNRHDNDSATLVGTSALRSFGSRLVNMATNLMLLGNYRDTQCGCKAFRADVGKAVLGAGLVDGFAFDIEMLHLVERYGFSLKEVPVEVVNSDTTTVRALRDGHRRRPRHPPDPPLCGAGSLSRRHRLGDTRPRVDSLT